MAALLVINQVEEAIKQYQRMCWNYTNCIAVMNGGVCSSDRGEYYVCTCELTESKSAAESVSIQCRMFQY